MKKKTVWSGEHGGITYEIQNFKMGGVFEIPEKDCWTFYLYIRLDSLPEGIRERFWLDLEKSGIIKSGTYRYDGEPLMAGLDWHCGMTWYSKESGFDGSSRCVKIGCDYQHLWDEGKYYCETGIERDAKQCIESLYEMIPNIKKRCPWCGEYVDELIQYGKGEMCSICVEKREEATNGKA